MKGSSQSRSWWQDFIATHKTRTGRYEPPQGKSVLVCSSGTTSKWTADFLLQLQQEYPRESIFFLKAGAIAQPLTSGSTVPYPYRFLGKSRYLRRLRANFILIDKGATPPKHFLRSALRSGIPLAYVDDKRMAGNAQTWPSPDDDQAAMPVVLSKLGDQAAPEAMAAISPLMAREGNFPEAWKKRAKFFLWRHVIYPFHTRSLRKLHNLAEVNSSLKNPGTILCLGNGPSSEDIQLSPQEYDALFRVNHRWLEKGLYARPDVVFTGAADSVLEVGRDIIYAFLSDSKALPIIKKVREDVNRLRFISAVELGFPIEKFAPHKPTNGLLMLYLAVALRPARLIIAGIDLYQDPRGCYPEESDTPNDYTSVHEADKELELILQLLSTHNGELVIIGDKLALEYERYTHEKAE